MQRTQSEEYQAAKCSIKVPYFCTNDLWWELNIRADFVLSVAVHVTVLRNWCERYWVHCMCTHTACVTNACHVSPFTAPGVTCIHKHPCIFCTLPDLWLRTSYFSEKSLLFCWWLFFTHARISIFEVLCWKKKLSKNVSHLQKKLLCSVLRFSLMKRRATLAGVLIPYWCDNPTHVCRPCVTVTGCKVVFMRLSFARGTVPVLPTLHCCPVSKKNENDFAVVTVCHRLG